jgi:hypothetical protein
MSNKFNGLAGVVENLGKGEKTKEYQQILGFLEKNVRQYDQYKK